MVTFLRRPPVPAPKLPIEQAKAHIFYHQGTEVFTMYVPTGSSPVFMNLIEKTFGKEVTTRTWETVQKCVRA